MRKAMIRSEKEQNDRVIMVDVMKGFCIIMVILTHVSTIPTHIRKLILYPFTILPAVSMFIMLSAYSFSLSEDRLEQTCGRVRTDSDWFERRQFLRKLGRFLLPFGISVFVLLAVLRIIFHADISFPIVFRVISLGGYGPGSYYVWIVFQLLLLFPFFRCGFKHNPIRMAVFLIVIHLLYELLYKYIWSFPSTVYSRLILGFFTQIAFGMLLYQYKDILRNSIIPFFLILAGTFYIILVGNYYLGYPDLVSSASMNRNMFFSLFSFGALAYLLQLEPLARRHKKILKPICFIGKASFHIMLTQTVYYYFARMTGFETRLEPLWLTILVDLGITLTAGCLFYSLCNLVRSYFGKFVYRD